ncbi:MAG TPA: PAS domain-containing protein [Rhizomicrobium sp.]|nr:PAS domain-containing protein [Rhizomicrobium sp.]
MPLPCRRRSFCAINAGWDGEVLIKTDALSRAADAPDFALVFAKMPGLCLVLDPGFVIVAQNEEHARATQATVVGQMVFAAFPDNPEHSGATGVAKIRASLLKVLKTRQADHLALLRYDVKPPLGRFQTRYWSVTNVPILGEDGYVRWILLRAEEMTELVEQRHRIGLSADGRVAPS